MFNLFQRTAISQQLEHKGYCFIPSSHYLYSQDAFLSLQEWKKAWQNLVKDCYLKDNGNYRYRRLGSFHLFPHKNQLIEQKIEGYYYQSSEHNPQNGGIKRKFAPLEVGFAANPILRNLIWLYFRTLPVKAKYHHQPWLVYVHPFRIYASENSLGYPTPEGIHRDGHWFTVQVFMERNNIKGGQSEVFNNSKKVLYSQTMKNCLDTMILNDSRLLHAVSPISCINSEASAYRDIFTVNFNLLSSERTTKMY
jgi:hypothetical protein